LVGGGAGSGHVVVVLAVVAVAVTLGSRRGAIERTSSWSEMIRVHGLTALLLMCSCDDCWGGGIGRVDDAEGARSLRIVERKSSISASVAEEVSR
jgi:hypothetical protein